MSNLQPNLPPGVFANPPKWKRETLTADDGKTFGYDIRIERQSWAQVEDTFNPGALVCGWWSWRVLIFHGRRATMFYRWCERLAGT
jgi:hypothetical protein